MISGEGNLNEATQGSRWKFVLKDYSILASIVVPLLRETTYSSISNLQLPDFCLSGPFSTWSSRDLMKIQSLFKPTS